MLFNDKSALCFLCRSQDKGAVEVPEVHIEIIPHELHVNTQACNSIYINASNSLSKVFMFSISSLLV